VQLLEIAKGFEDQEIHASLEECRDLLAKRCACFPRARSCPMAQSGFPTAHRPGDVRVKTLGCLAGKLGTGQVDGSDFLRETIAEQPKRSCRNVFVSMISAPACKYSRWMPRIEIRLRQVQLVVTGFHEHTLRIEHGPPLPRHRAMASLSDELERS